MNADAPVVFELEEATLGYGRRTVLRGTSLAVRSGEFWCLIGPNAAGKTTLLRALLRDIAPLAGALVVDPVLAAPSRVGFVPQQCSLNPTLPTTVREFVGLGLVGIRAGRKERRERLRWALETVSLDHLERANYFRLSGGQRQRALLARALVRRPAVLILDEPTQELDAVAERQLLETVGTLNVRDGVTVIVVTHELDIAVRYATHVAFVRGGTVVSGLHDRMLTPQLLGETFGTDPSFFEGLQAVARYSNQVP
jgi:ABC-type Mn2+/Zn2+ transport system ATPase subunit